MTFYLDPETLYIIWNHRTETYSYARTPDGIGCYWYDEDQREEARGDVCDVKRAKHFDSHAEFDDYRNGEHLVQE
jgi:hypothetical protein